MSRISIIIPLYNESEILEKQINKLLKDLKKQKIDNYEVLLVENGSKDSTWKILKELKKKSKKLRIFRLKDASYGAALRKGIKKSRFETIVQFDIDFIDVSFLNKALKFTADYDIVIGSKIIDGSNDKRPLARVFITRLMNLMVRLFLNYDGTDTHGIKVYKKRRIELIVNKVKSSHHFFDTELVLIAQKRGFKIKEIPVSVFEIRRTRFPFAIRFKQTIFEFWALKKRLLKIEPKFTFIADDYGYGDKSNEKIRKLVKKRKIKIFSVLSNFLFEKKTKDTFLKGKKVALHFNLVEKSAISKKEKVQSLVDNSGEFYSRYIFLLRLFFKFIKKQEIKKELEAQYNFLVSMGADVIEINSHDHTHAFSPVAKVVQQFAKKKNLSVRLYGNFYPQSLRAKLVFLVMKSAARISNFVYLGKLNLPVSWKSSNNKITFMSLEDRLPQKNLELVVHPELFFDKNIDYERFF